MPYTTLYEGTDHFSKLPYKEGGYKLGEGGFGEVFWCRVMVGGCEKPAAVKVLNKVVSHVQREPSAVQMHISLVACFHGYRKGVTLWL